MVYLWSKRENLLMLNFYKYYAKTNIDGYGFWAKDLSGREYLERNCRSKEFRLPLNPVNTFLLHCRLASSGDGKFLSSRENHPFVSEDKRWLLCHNGTVWNWEKLSLFLEKQGHKFVSDVDSEVLLHFWEEIVQNYETNGIKKKAVIHLMKDLDQLKVCGWMNLFVLDRWNEKWFAISEGRIKLSRPLNNRDLIVSSDFNPLNHLALLNYEITTGYAVIGRKNRVYEHFKVGKLSEYNSFGMLFSGKESELVEEYFR